MWPHSGASASSTRPECGGNSLDYHGSGEETEAPLSHSTLIFTADEQNGRGLGSLPALQQKPRSCQRRSDGVTRAHTLRAKTYPECGVLWPGPYLPASDCGYHMATTVENK